MVDTHNEILHNSSKDWGKVMCIDVEKSPRR